MGSPTLSSSSGQSKLLPGILALLVCNGARGLTGGLAGGLALTAAALGSAVLQRGAVQRLDMLHRKSPLNG